MNYFHIRHKFKWMMCTHIKNGFCDKQTFFLTTFILFVWQTSKQLSWLHFADLHTSSIVYSVMPSVTDLFVQFCEEI